MKKRVRNKTSQNLSGFDSFLLINTGKRESYSGIQLNTDQPESRFTRTAATSTPGFTPK